MTLLDTGTYGAKRQSYTKGSPRELLLRLIGKHPNATEDELLEMSGDIVFKDRELFDSEHEYWFANNYRSLTNLPRVPNKPDKANIRAMLTKVKRHVRKEAQAMFLDMVLPTNGKQLRDCTGKDCAKAGGLFTKIAERIKPNDKVGAVLSEQQVRKMFG